MIPEVGFGEGCPLPNEEGSGEEAVPLPRKFFEFLSRNGAFLCILLMTGGHGKPWDSTNRSWNFLTEG